MRYLIANWKAEVNKGDVDTWLREFQQLLSDNPGVQTAIHTQSLAIIICPSTPFISEVKTVLESFAIAVGSQDVSSHDKGKFTGEVTAYSLNKLVQFAIIGHSERRIHCHESEEEIQKKIYHCQTTNIEPILCVRNENDKVYPNIKIIAYEPVGAIGNGHNESPENIIAMKNTMKIDPSVSFLYGGSVDENNVKDYIQTKGIDGFLVGTASLHPQQFMSLAVKLV